MWNFMVAFLNPKSKGFSLIEYLLGIGLISVLLVSIFPLFYIVRESYLLSESYNDIYLNGQYGLEYIKNEVLSADKIISSSKIKGLDRQFPNNIGFVLMVRNGDEFTFITYYIGGKKLIRIASNENTANYPHVSKLKGFNEIARDILSFTNTDINVENKLLNLEIRVGRKQSNPIDFKTTIYLRCLLDF